MKYIYILIILSLFFLSSCSLFDKDSSHDPDFEDIVSLDFGNNNFLYVEGTTHNSKRDYYRILYGIDSNGNANEIICMDKHGDTIDFETIDLYQIIDLNRDYFLIQKSSYSSDKPDNFLIINKHDGSAQLFPIPSGATKITKGIKNNTFYFWILDDLHRFTLSDTSPINIESIYSTDTSVNCLFSGNGDLLVSDTLSANNFTYIYISSDGHQVSLTLNENFSNIYVNPHGYFEYHDFITDEMVTLTYDSATGVVNTIRISDNGLLTEPNLKPAFRYDEYIIKVGYLGNSGVYEMHNPTDLPREISFSEADEIITAAASDTNYFLSCRDASGNPSLLRIDPLTDDKTVLLPLGEYEVNEISALYNNNLFLTGLNMATGKTSFLWIKPDRSVVKMSEDYSKGLPSIISLN